MSDTTNSYNKEKFLMQFQGMEDLALHAVSSFLDNLPDLLSSIEKSLKTKNPKELELSAHTLKGVLSNFYAEPSQLLAWKLEQIGSGQVMDDSAIRIYENLKREVTILANQLFKLKNQGIAS